MNHLDAMQRSSLPLLVMAGTLVRFAFGSSHELWNSAPDQLAWGLALEDLVNGGSFAYRQLIHYPHEGGSSFLGLLAFLFVPLSGIMPPLSWAALLVDTLVRIIQINVAHRLFGARTAMWFAVWTVFAAPLMLPWSIIDFGLHALMSFAPFVLIAFAMRKDRSRFVLGLFCGALASLAYDVWIFAPAWIIFELFSKDRLNVRMKRIVMFGLGAVLAFLPHLFIRTFIDHGFALEELSVLSVRGLEKEGIDLSTWPGKTWAVLTAALPGSFALLRMDQWLPRLLATGVLALIVLGVSLAWRIKDERSPALHLMILTVLVFLLALIIGPFFEPRADGNGYLYYRYFPFIAPLLVLLIIEGSGELPRYGNKVRTAWIVGCLGASLVHMYRTPHYASPNDEATGWVLGRKFGDDPERLRRIIDGAGPVRHDPLVKGAAWGFTAALFDRRSTADTTALQEFERIWHQLPDTDHALLRQGVHRAFDPGVTPVLDPGLAAQVFALSDE